MSNDETVFTSEKDIWVPADEGGKDDAIVNPEPGEIALICDPCMYSPEQWGSPDSWGEPSDGMFWAYDTPEKREGTAFGVLAHNPLQVDAITIHSFELDTTLPNVPPELPVYLQGSYPATHKDLFDQTFNVPKRWEYHPAYSGIYYTAATPLPHQVENPDENSIKNKAKDILGELLMPDFSSTTIQREDGSWVVLFHRYVDERKVYVDKPLMVIFDKDGRAELLQGRRKPIIEESLYPTRSPQQAWEDLIQGNWLLLYIWDDFLHEINSGDEIDQFIVKEVELAYHEQHPSYPTQVMQPYYIFRNEHGQALYVPAIADPYVE